VEGFSTPNKRSDQLVLEANMEYWDKNRFPRLKRIVFDNTLDQKEAVELVKTSEGRVDLVSELSPLDTLRVAQSPFAKVVKNRGSLWTVFGMLNMQKEDSPWRDIRLRQAVNFAIHREDLIRYATKGNGIVIPGLLPVNTFGYDPNLAPYPFDPAKAHQLVREAGHPNGLPVTLIASEDLIIQATVVGKMLEQVGFTVDLQILDTVAYDQKTLLSHLDRPPEQQPWDIALVSFVDFENFPAFMFYHYFALDGVRDWATEQVELRRLYAQVLGTTDQEKQQGLIRQMERHARDHVYFLFLYNPITLYAVNKAVEFVPYVNGILNLAETSVTDEHWSVRGEKSRGRFEACSYIRQTHVQGGKP
jgi:peptide/nickel transport system substrate-binding protein